MASAYRAYVLQGGSKFEMGARLVEWAGPWLAAAYGFSKIPAPESRVFHSTYKSNVSSIMNEGLRSGTYATPTKGLSSSQAQGALKLSGPLRNTVLEIDVAGLRAAGYEIPRVTRVVGGTGYEMKFLYEIPPQFIKEVIK
ncbi:MAG: hypothetical protein HZA49_09280 [Planctomycetes bacterium]|nr:hypothetical protein [Planctomycetota bacterium]